MNEREELIRQAYIKQAYEKRDSLAPVVQEQHPEIGVIDRFAIKNLDMSPEQTQKYLKKEYPKMKFKMHNNQVAVKFKEDEVWKVIDPSGFDLQDVTDLAGMVPEGAAQVAGGSLGALAGTTAGPWGTIPGMMVGAGAAGGIVNSAKQGIRKMIGAQDDFDPAEAGISAGISGLLGPFFGGASSNAVKKVASPTVKKIAERGLVGMGYDAVTRKAAPAVAGFLSNTVPAEEFRYAVSNPKILEKISVDPLKAIGTLRDHLRARIGQAKTILQPEYEALANSNAPIDLTGTMTKLRNIVINLQKSVDQNPGNKAFQKKLGQAWNIYDEYALEGTGVARKEIGKTTVSNAMRLKGLLGDLADSNSPKNMAVSNKNGAIYAAAVDAKAKINSSLDEISGGLRKNYKKISDNERNIEKLFGGKTSLDEATKGENLLNRLGKNKAFTEEVKKVAGPLKFESASGSHVLPGSPIEEIALAQKAYHSLHKPSFKLNFTNRTLGNLGARMVLGGALGSPWGMGGVAAGAGAGMMLTSPGMLKTYLTGGRGFERFIGKRQKFLKPGIRGLITNQLGE